MSKSNRNIFEEENIWKIFLKIAPPVMLAQLIQSLYNIVDSCFVGKYSGEGLSALAVIYPIQLIITAIAVGTGVGVNTLMSRYFAQDKFQKAYKVAGTGTLLGAISWLLFSLISVLILKPYITMTVTSPIAIKESLTYGFIVCVGSIGIFLESIWSKVHQASGNMKLPMIAQVIGALTNIVLDPILIFGYGIIPEMGIAGAAIATVVGQVVAALITISGCHRLPKIDEFKEDVKYIYKLGFPNIFMQTLYTVYIVILNMILGGFSDEAVSVLGLYYKVQSFFFIPLHALQTCIVPLISYTYALNNYQRIKKIMNKELIVCAAFMTIGVLCFEIFPIPLLKMFTSDPLTLEIGKPAFRIAGSSFLPAAFSLSMPVFFQAIGKGKASITLSLTRQIFCLIPIFWLLSLISLNATWFAFPISETITGLVGIGLLLYQYKKWHIYGNER